MTTQETAKRLYTLAAQADARFTATIAARTEGRRDRWTMTGQDWMIPEVWEAYRAKLAADEVWLTFLRHARKVSDGGVAC